MIEYQIKEIGGYLIRLKFEDKSYIDLIQQEFKKSNLNILKVEDNLEDFEIIFVKDDFEVNKNKINRILENLSTILASSDEQFFIKEVNSDIEKLHKKIDNYLFSKYNQLKGNKEI